MAIRRTDRLGSLIKQVIADVILRDVKNPHLPSLLTVTSVDITKDLRQAKVYVSVIGDLKKKEKAIETLNQAAGFIAARASKQVVMRYFPALTFHLDETVEKQGKMQELIEEVQKEREAREGKDES